MRQLSCSFILCKMAAGLLEASPSTSKARVLKDFLGPRGWLSQPQKNNATYFAPVSAHPRHARKLQNPADNGHAYAHAASLLQSKVSRSLGHIFNFYILTQLLNGLYTISQIFPVFSSLPIPSLSGNNVYLLISSKDQGYSNIFNRVYIQILFTVTPYTKYALEGEEYW